MSKPSQQTFQQTLLSNKFIVFGHRGVAKDKHSGVNENTPRAVGVAVKQGADGVEADAWFLPNGIDHQDGNIIVYHDEQYGGNPTPSWTVPTIREYDKERQNPLDKIPLLSEFVELFNEFPNLLFNLELKRLESKQKNKEPLTREDNQLVEQSMKILYDSGIQNRVIISSFDIGLLERVKDAAQEIARGVLVRREDYPKGLTKEAAIELLKKNRFNCSESFL